MLAFSHTPLNLLPHDPSYNLRMNEFFCRGIFVSCQMLTPLGPTHPESLRLVPHKLSATFGFRKCKEKSSILFLCLLGPPLRACSYFVISFHSGISCVWTPLPICDFSCPVKSYFLVLIAKLYMTISFVGHALAECWIFCLFPSRVLNRRSPPGLTFPQPLYAFELFASWKSSWQPLIFYSRKRPWPITSSNDPWCGIS